MGPRDEEDVRRCLRVEVLEGYDVVIFVDDPGRDGTRCNPAKDAPVHCFFTHARCPFLPCFCTFSASTIMLGIRSHAASHLAVAQYSLVTTERTMKMRRMSTIAMAGREEGTAQWTQ